MASISQVSAGDDRGRTPPGPEPEAVSESGPREAVDTRLPLEREGQYTRLEELGRGGQSVVLRAYDEFVAREVALKELAVSSEPGASGAESADVSTERERVTVARRRFLREARLTARLDHPGIVSVLELARRADGTIFCAQKLIRGETLKRRLQRCSSLTERLQLLPHLIAACQAVAYAHSRRIIHRDLKPSNIMVGSFGETVVVDWGLAKASGEPDIGEPALAPTPEGELTRTGIAMGTPGYMSPEQARGQRDRVDERSDVFSLGVVLYELLTGHVPFGGATAEHILERLLSGRFRPVRAMCPDAPPELAAIAERSLRSEPDGRYADAEELARDLTAYHSGGRVQAYEYGTWELLRKFASSHRALLTGVGIAVGALLVAAGVVVARLHQARVDLASSFRERGYRAEQEGDWSGAAAFFAAARAQNDTSEERWGLAIAGERVIERILSRQGPPESFIDVGTLPDGRVITVGFSQGSKEVEVREAESGRTLWTSSGELVLEALLLPQGLVRLTYPDGWVFHDGATGRELGRWPRSSGFPCSGPFPPRAVNSDGQLLRVNGAERRILATDPTRDDELCVVSNDGHQVVYQTRSFGLRLLSLDDGHELAPELARRNEPYRGLRFSHRGLIIIRQGRIEVVGGPDGEFNIELPDARFGAWSFTPVLGGSAVSPDGDLVAIPSHDGVTQVSVVDLRTRSIRGIIRHVRGWPRLAFSLDGRRVYAAGMSNASVLSGWRLPADDMPRRPRWWTTGKNSEDGRTSLLWDVRSGRYEFYRPPGTLVASGVHEIGRATAAGVSHWDPHLVGDSAATFLTGDSATLVLLDLETNQVLWQHPCRPCQAFSVSGDGSRLALVGADGTDVWNTRTWQSLFHETRRVQPSSTNCLSRDGRRYAWTFVDTLYLRELDSARELALPLDGTGSDLRFSPDGTKLLVVTNSSLTLREVPSGRALWGIPKELPDITWLINWSPDGRAVIVSYGLNATEVLDTRTGERLAWFQALRRAVTPVRAEVYAADLRSKGVAAEKTWDALPLPHPDETPADQSLARMLQRTGLQLRGVELVAAQ